MSVTDVSPYLHNSAKLLNVNRGLQCCWMVVYLGTGRSSLGCTFFSYQYVCLERGIFTQLLKGRPSSDFVLAEATTWEHDIAVITYTFITSESP